MEHVRGVNVTVASLDLPFPPFLLLSLSVEGTYKVKKGENSG